MNYLVTGAAGFIGNEVCLKLLAAGHQVVGLDNLNDYYDVQLKEDRLARVAHHANFHLARISVEDRAAMAQLQNQFKFDVIIHLAAQAGVRYSIDNPAAYVDANLVGFGNILELARSHKVQHLVYASSSSVYGSNKKQPFSEDDAVDHPVSLYAASKKANEVMAHTYSHLYNIPTTGLRFFTVYGPWGRPDMALFKFTKAVLSDQPIDVYNFGDMERDFTYIDDIVDGILKSAAAIPQAQNDGEYTPAESHAPYRVFNIGNSKPVKLTAFIAAIEKATGKTAQQNLMPIQPGDVPSTYADVSRLHALTGYQPSTEVEDGVAQFVAWYRDYYQV